MSWRFIDTHCHFDFPPFTGDERASIQRACEAGVEKIIVPATEAAHFPRVLALAARFPSLYAALGLYPIVIERHADDDPDKLQQALAQQQNVVAVGEIGLDLYRDDPQFARQERFLDVQLQLAKRYDLPVILHSRRTHDKLAMHLKRRICREPVWCMVLPAVCSRPNALCDWAIKSASAAPSPTRAPVKPVMLWRGCRWTRCCWRPMRRICR